MNKIFSIVFTLISFVCFSQSVDVGTNVTPNAGAELNVESATKGVLIPRLSSGVIATLSATAKAGLLVYNVDEHAFNYYDGVQWVSFPQINLTELSDANGDTKVEVDRLGDGTEDEIHFTTAGHSVAKMDHTGVDLLTSTVAPVYLVAGDHGFSVANTNSTFAGVDAGAAHAGDVKQTFIGANAGKSATGSAGNTVVGSGSLQSAASSQNNVVVGASNAPVLAGADNVILGTDNGTSSTSASGGVIIGNNSLPVLSLEHANTVIGSSCGSTVTGSRNVIVGMNADVPGGASFNVNVGNILYAEGGKVNFNKQYSFPSTAGNTGAILVLSGNQLNWGDKIPKSVVSAAAELQPYDRGVASGTAAFGSANTVYYMEAFSFTTAEMNSFLTQVVANSSASTETIKMAIYSDSDNDGTYTLEVYGQSLLPAGYTGVPSVKFGFQRKFSGVLVDEKLSDLGLPASPESFEVKAGVKYYLALWCSSVDLSFKSLNKANGVYTESYGGTGLPASMAIGSTTSTMYWLRGYFE